MQIARARADETSLAAQQTGRLHIGQSVADPPGPREVDVERLRSFAKQLEAGLAAVARTAELRVMRAEVRTIDACSMRGEQLAEPPLYSLVVVDRVAAPRDSRLIGDHDNAGIRGIEAANRLRGAWQQLDLLRLVQKPWILDDCAVAVEEDCAPPVNHAALRLQSRLARGRSCGRRAAPGSPRRAR